MFSATNHSIIPLELVHSGRLGMKSRRPWWAGGKLFPVWCEGYTMWLLVRRGGEGRLRTWPVKASSSSMRNRKCFVYCGGRRRQRVLRTKRCHKNKFVFNGSEWYELDEESDDGDGCLDAWRFIVCMCVESWLLNARDKSEEEHDKWSFNN